MAYVKNEELRKLMYYHKSARIANDDSTMMRIEFDLVAFGRRMEAEMMRAGKYDRLGDVLKK